MFTGLVQKVGRVSSLTSDGQGGGRLSITTQGWVQPLILGESIAVNGACLTVAAIQANELHFDCGPETLNRTNLGQLQPTHRVNLERALRLGDALGGHFVTGHIDTTGQIIGFEPNGGWVTLTLAVPKQFDELLVVKGSVAVDGVSLTLVTVEPERISIMLIPHTLAETTLGDRKIGDSVNLEFDLLAKHVQKLFKNLTIEL